MCVLIPCHLLPQVLEDVKRRLAMLKQRPTALDEFMTYQVCVQEIVVCTEILVCVTSS